MATAGPTISAPGNKSRCNERIFFSGMAMVLLIAVFAGFAPTYYLRGTFASPQLTPSLLVHGLAFSSWMVLLVVQTMLIAANRPDIHRWLGVVGAALAVVMMFLGAYVAISRTASGQILVPPGISPLANLAVPLATLFVFPALLGSAIWFRRRPDVHKRLVLIATLELVTAAVGRLPGIFNPLGSIALGVPGLFIVTDLLLVPIAVYDRRSLGRIHPATLWGGAFLVVSQPLRGLIGTTATWISFAEWLTR
jgi:hypothetical protein